MAALIQAQNRSALSRFLAVDLTERAAGRPNNGFAADGRQVTGLPIRGRVPKLVVGWRGRSDRCGGRR